MAPENPLKSVFEHLRSLLTCVSLITLAAAACRLHQHLALASWLTYTLSGIVITLTGGLVLANAVVIVREFSADRRWLTLGVLAGIYVCIVILLVHAALAIGVG